MDHNMQSQVVSTMEHGVSHHDSKEEGISPSADDEKDHENGIKIEPDQQSPRSASLSSFGWVILCLSMLIAELQAALDSTITADLQPTIIATFGEISKFPWINVTYSLGLGGSCLLW